MSTSHLDEWAELGDAWRTDETVVPNGDALQRLRQRVRTRTVWRVLTIASEVALTIAVLTWAFAQHNESGTKAVVVRVATIAFTALVWAFGLWNRRNGWRVLGESSANFVRLSHVRIAEARRSIVAVRVTLGLTLLGIAPWLVNRVLRGTLRHDEWVSWGVFALYVVAMFTWCAVYARWVDREELVLREIEGELE